MKYVLWEIDWQFWLIMHLVKTNVRKFLKSFKGIFEFIIFALNGQKQYYIETKISEKNLKKTVLAFLLNRNIGYVLPLDYYIKYFFSLVKPWCILSGQCIFMFKYIYGLELLENNHIFEGKRLYYFSEDFSHKT